jgi:hypothetical protein
MTPELLELPVFVLEKPYDSPLIFHNQCVRIADKPHYEVALACARQFCVTTPKDRELFLENVDFSLRGALAFAGNLPLLDRDKRVCQLRYAGQIFDSPFVKDLYADIETLAMAYVAENGMTWGSEEFRDVLQSKAQELKTAGLLAKYPFLREVLVGQVACSIGDLSVYTDNAQFIYYNPASVNEFIGPDEITMLANAQP